MSRQLDYYKKNREAINKRKREQRKNVKPCKAKSKAVFDVKPSPTSNWVNGASSIRISIGTKQFLKQPIACQQIEARLLEAAIQYHYSREQATIFYFFAYKGFPMRLTTRSITAWAMEESDAVSEPELKQREAAVRQELRHARRELACLLRLQLEQEEEVVQEHVAFVEDYFARKWRAEEGTVLSIPDRQDGKERMRVDVSTGVPEFEFTHKKKALSDSLAYVKHVEQVADGIWNIDKQLQFNQQSIERQQTEQLFFQTHNRLMAKIAKMVDKLTEKLGQQRLFP